MMDCRVLMGKSAGARGGVLFLELVRGELQSSLAGSNADSVVF
jgi:hypothetical protein